MYVLLQNSKRICFTLLVQVDFLSFPELHKEKHKEKHLLPTIVLSAGASPVRDFASCPLLSTNIPEETTAVGMKSAKQQRQAEVWVVGLFCLPLSNSLLEFCQLNNRALLSTLMEARLEKKVSGPMARRLLSKESGNMTPSVMSAQPVTCAVFLPAQWLNRANTDLHYYYKAWAQEKKKK